MGQYYLEGNTYVIKNYDRLPAFSSFLPGLAGVKGIPLWVYYTNRGQGINSFGIHNKSNAIMEFNPANTAYENTSIKGFRTFIKCDGKYYEPFFNYDKEAIRNLYIRKNSITIEEINEAYDLKISVKYYVLPNDSIGGLVRKVCIENTGNGTKKLSVLDGMPKIIPYGIKNNEYKEMSNLLKSWTEIKNLENQIPFYTLRASSDDSAEVTGIEGGYYYVSVHKGQVLPVIYDAQVIFGYDTSLVTPVEFLEGELTSVVDASQEFANKVPCGFTPAEFELKTREIYEFNTIIGYAGIADQINEKQKDFLKEGFFPQKEIEAEEAANLLTRDVKTMSALPVFDQYVEQCYLDNFLRGGYPFVFNKDSSKAVVHLFSRKHGDPERDYNFFSIAGEYYSQGNGNFRDVSQNRRNDVFFNKDIGNFNIKTFYDLIQIDGYNPLEVRPSTFCIPDKNQEEAKILINDSISDNRDKVEAVISKAFTPGQVANCIARYHLDIKGGEDSFLEKLLKLSIQNTEAGFGEGYWSDHWDYNLDLIENYIRIYPDKREKLLFEDSSYRFYDSAARVVNRSEKYVIHKNEVRQYGALVEDEVKCSRKDFNKKGTNWLKINPGTDTEFNYGTASYAETTLMVKLISLALNKFSSLDPYGMGVEMEGGKPGWNDAMNGLPGLIGSGMPETFELKRVLQFICDTVTIKPGLLIPEEIYEFLIKVYTVLTQAETEKWSDFTYWDKVSTFREIYRETTRFHLSGRLRKADTKELLEVFEKFMVKLEAGIRKAIGYGEGIVPTYFTYHAVSFTPVTHEDGSFVMSHYGLPKAVVKAFEVVPLPAFLEGPARMLGTLTDKESARILFQNVKTSSLYDDKLKMYKTSVPIENISMENGRIRAFTPGWLERESIFLHMEYKYLLAMLKSGLYENFFEEIKNTLVAFLPPERYGRSILENSSFIASSENPDSQVHGRGYVARLSGSTTEVLSMWIFMFIGERIFTYDNGELRLNFSPKLPGWFFDDKGEVTFNLLSSCMVTYINKSHKDTFGDKAAKIRRIVIPSTGEEFEEDFLSGETAKRVRDGDIKAVMAYME
ncbi:cellobiose phosphorylase [Anaerocolumna sp. AGMB13025]|uniref:cellobiose phosphorylase n=1 Tax=Anaerocolumna sp. AGMB13025 TaxID=3039116 RepID=UPI00241C1398|nr:cellobiose phosphorylase [Anaerocolumna sp. AGMB13025]WFR58443.1 cellobiose phosphorylase [Anaerocolumna sp. AGMB13025]